jgi:hypothetical protein
MSLGLGRRDVAEPRFHRPPAQILGERRGDFGLPLIAQPLNPTQLFKTPCHSARAAAA